MEMAQASPLVPFDLQRRDRIVIATVSVSFWGWLGRSSWENVFRVRFFFFHGPTPIFLKLGWFGETSLNHFSIKDVRVLTKWQKMVEFILLIVYTSDGGPYRS